MEYVNITKGQAQESTSESFSYSYSSETQKELDKITKKYQPVSTEVTKMEQLKQLDKSVTKPGTIASLAIGIGSSLIMGTGMSLCMVAGGEWLIPGIIIGVIGMAGAGVAYPIYAAITKSQKAKKAPMILSLAEEIAKEQ